MPSTSQLTIRLATPGDASAIAAVLHESFFEFRPLYTDGGFAATALQAEQVLARMGEGPVWAAQCGGVLLGTVAAIAKEKSVYVRGMAVLPAARGSGTAAALLQHVEKWAASQGCGRLFLTTTPFLNSAIRLYERWGFRRINDGPHELFGTPLFYMEKILSQP